MGGALSTRSKLYSDVNVLALFIKKEQKKNNMRKKLFTFEKKIKITIYNKKFFFANLKPWQLQTPSQFPFLHHNFGLHFQNSHIHDTFWLFIKKNKKFCSFCKTVQVKIWRRDNNN